MISLEQVRLLETKVTKVIDYVKKMTEENSRLKEKLDSCQKRVEELEVLVQAFKDDQGRIEDGILAALDQLNQVEDAIGKTASPSPDSGAEPPPAPSARKKPEAVKPEPEPEPEEETQEAGDSGQDSGELDIF